ncbi:hypothetical protein A8709_05115 [Paenibacillus pectinilyticus]|uniref:Heparinase II/III-like C-terminal domain-containing protein n=1 Tax=Paenibacillus pectinilyticus TaxID=512399 RepID=A0A1C0ZSM9_9BACL|nr:heparinase II/III family protein [Paenibacillus pectinilyticus]OCT11078.1 hypothetical protein A8709_05115 [Paenibacillus pectinilyticus]
MMTQEELYTALIYGAEEGGERLLLPEARNRDKWREMPSSPFYKSMLDEVVEAEKQFPPYTPAISFSLYRLYDDTGTRLAYEKAYFHRRQKLSAYAILSLAYGEERHIRALEDIIWAICDEFTWSLPAHLDGKSLVGKNVGSHRYMVELFAAETAFYLAEIASLLKDKLAEAVVHRIAHEVEDRVFSAYAKRAFYWETEGSNWTAVCSGAIGMAAMYLIKDEAKLAAILERTTAGMACFIGGYLDDGACCEGVMYWNYGFGYFVMYAELLKERSGGRMDLMQVEKIRRIALFQQKSYLSRDQVVNFADCIPGYRYSIGLTHRLHRTYAEVEVPSPHYAMRFQDDHCYRWGQIVRSFVWSDPEIGETLREEAFHYFPETQVVVSRSGSGEHKAGFAAKGGHNGEFHNHNDLGHFVFQVNGETLLADLGAGEYTKEYGVTSRYQFIGTTSRGHSVPIVNGTFQSAGPRFSAQVVEAVSTPEQDVFELELANAYDIPELTSMRRRFLFKKKGPISLGITDSFTSLQTINCFVERFVTFQEPTEVEPGRVRIQGSHAHADLTYDAGQLSAECSQDIFSNHLGEHKTVYLIDLTLLQKGKAGKVNIWIETQG